MAKTKTSKGSKTPEKTILNRTTNPTSKSGTPKQTSTELLAQATTALQTGDAEDALNLARQALGLVNIESVEALPALNVLGEICIEIGDIDSAREYFLIAANIDDDGSIPEENGGGAEKFLWLAQLSEEGGADSVGWFERGASCLRDQISTLLDSHKTSTPTLEARLAEKRRKLAGALCGVVEVYMTDLSWEADAEQVCERLVTEATLVAPGDAEPWQTLANVRLSQERREDACAALKRSLDVWRDLEPEDEGVPDFPTRVSLARLLMEAEMEEEAIEVLERLVLEDDSSVETWYLGGWGLYILGEKQAQKEGEDAKKATWISSRQWLNNSMKLYALQEYEDERLGQHAKELIDLLDANLGGPAAEDEEDEEWEGIESDGDEEMADI